MIPPFTSVIFDPFIRPSALQKEVHGYFLTEVIGHGSAGNVYIGLKSNRNYRVKELFTGRHNQEKIRWMRSSLERFALLSNKHLSPLLEWHQTSDSLYLFSNLASGISAEKIFRAPLGWSLAINIAKEIGQSLAYAWNFQGIAHGNLKPSNIFLDLIAGEVKNVTVTDFGLSGTSPSDSIGILSAARAFQAPEWTGLGPPDFQGDIFSLGAILFYLATGRIPSDNSLSDPVLLKEIPVDFVQVVRSFMRQQSTERPKSWAEALDLLNRVCQADPFEVLLFDGKRHWSIDTSPPSRFLDDSVASHVKMMDAHNAVLNEQLLDSIGISHDLEGDIIEKGSIVAGNYRVIHCLSREINFSLYEVEDTILTSRMYLKIISTQGMKFPLVRQRLHVESTLLASLDSQFYPVAIGRGVWNARDYAITKRPFGYRLSAYLLNNALIDEGQALWIASQLAVALKSGLETAHLIHRDICPDHLVIVDGQVPRLMMTDCSLAHGRVPLDTEDFAQRDQLPTISVGPQLAVGTPAYMAPEQIHGDIPSISMDIYAIGCLLFRLIAGRTPFIANNALRMLHLHLYERPPSLNKFSQVTDATNKLVKDCLAKNPDQRPKDYQELISELNKCAFSLDLETKRQVSAKTTKRIQTKSTRRVSPPN